MKSRAISQRKSVFENSVYKSVNSNGFQFSITHQLGSMKNSTITMLDSQKKLQKNYYKHYILSLVDSKIYKIINCILTVISLYANDFKLLFTNRDSDIYFDVLLIIIISYFLLENLVLFIFDDGYGCSLFFWTDLTGSASILLEITGINSQVQSLFNSDYRKSLNKITLLIIRFLKGIQTIRILRLLKINELLKGKNNKPDKKEENLSTKFEQLVFNKMVILIFFMLIAIYLFDPEIYNYSLSKNEFSIQIFNDFKPSSQFSTFLFSVFIKKNKNDKETPLLFTSIYGQMFINDKYTEHLRDIEKIYLYDDCRIDRKKEDILRINPNVNISRYEELERKGELPTLNVLVEKCVAIFNNRKFLKKTSALSIIKTTVVLGAFSFGFLLIGNDTKTVILVPLENMTKKIKSMSLNPISAIQSEDEPHKSDKKNKSKKKCCGKNKSEKNHKMFETTLLQKKISKICALLVLGFGEAGSVTISSVLQEGIDSEMNPLLSGKKIYGIFGFCDIRNFTDTTDVLKEKVMIFVNQVAEIVHEIVNDFSGSANKNIGDAFLLVWKFEQKFAENDRVKKCKEVSHLCDMALISFLLIIMTVQKSQKLAEYRKHKELNERMKNYSVKLGFGLHLGYAIEGAIGSLFKIDASYLSHDVDMSNKLEEKTKDFGKEIILSGDFVDYLTEDAKKYVRLLDMVKNKEGEKIKYYTVDMNVKTLKVVNSSQNEEREKPSFQMDRVMKRRIRSKYLYKKVMKNKIDPWKHFEKNSDFLLTRKEYPQEFMNCYNQGMDCFIRGNWHKAKEFFETAEVSRLIFIV